MAQIPLNTKLKPLSSCKQALLCERHSIVSDCGNPPSGMASPASVVIFQKTLQDLVKGIRGQRKDASSYISRVIAEIKTELRSTDQFTKAEAVSPLKTAYIKLISCDPCYRFGS